MSKKDDGGPAFPRPISEDRTSGDLPDGNAMVAEQTGMSLRDFIASQMLAGLAANSDEWGLPWHESNDTTDEKRMKGALLRARQCYLMADAMLIVRGEKSP